MTYRILLVLLCTFLPLRAMAHQTSAIAESAQQVQPLLNGQTPANVTLHTPEGDPVSLQALWMQQPTIVLFYRGGWCPYCSRQLAGLKELEQRWQQMGYQVLALSPDTPARLQAQKLNTDFAVTILSDANLQAMKAFGVLYYMDEALEKRYEEKLKMQLTDDPDSGRAVLPVPSVFILNPQGQVVFNYVNPDYKVRISVELLYQAARLSLPQQAVSK